jgi:hypothetical protein
MGLSRCFRATWCPPPHREVSVSLSSTMVGSLGSSPLGKHWVLYLHQSWWTGDHLCNPL